MMNWIISSSILILIIITIRHFLKGKMSLCLQYGLWLIVAVRLLIPFSIGEAVTSVSTWLDLVGDRQAVQEIVDFTQTPIRDMVYEETYFDSVPESDGVQGDGIETLPDDDISGKVEYEISSHLITVKVFSKDKMDKKTEAIKKARKCMWYTAQPTTLPFPPTP